MDKIEISLDGSWKLKGFPKLNGEEEGAYKPEHTLQDWLPATVPGVVHTDLIANNNIPDPFNGLNEEIVRWVEDVEWWYRRDFELPENMLEKEAVELTFRGLDTFATIWVNGSEVGETHNMFTPWRFEIRAELKPGWNTIVVRLKPAGKIAQGLEEKYRDKYGLLHSSFHSARPYIRKAQYSFGWDWGPRLPTAGIYRSVELTAYDRARLGYLTALPLEVSCGKARVKLTTEVHACGKVRAKVRFAIEGYEQRAEKWIEADIEKGRNDLECEVEIQKPRLWSPRGYGLPHLYKIVAELYVGDRLLDRAETKAGIRSVELVQEPDEEGRSFVFKVNGKPTFCKGAAWIPADSFLPRVSRDRYRELLALSAEANMNMLRVWGGGVYEDDAFYDMCDELGIMIWHDFMYACAEYPEEDWLLEEAEREAEEVVRRLRRHPCIVLWCGNNENDWIYQMNWRDRGRLLGLTIYEKILPRVCSKLDPTRPYWPSSPYGGEDPNSPTEGDRHNWEVWSRWIDYPAYLKDRGRFLSEFGWQAPPTLTLLQEHSEPDDQYTQSRFMEAHEKQQEGLERLYRFLAAHYPVPEDLKLFTLYCQLNQGEALKTAIEHWRSRMFKTSGCLVWQLEDCWPALSWSLVDYGLNPKPAYYFVKRAFQPVIAALTLKDGAASVYIVNETDKDLRGTLGFHVMDFHGETHYSELATASAPPRTSKLVLEKNLDKLPLADDRILTVILEKDETTLYEEARTIQQPKHLKLPEPHVAAEVVKSGAGRFKVSLQSDVYAKALCLKLERAKASVTDNFFDLIPRRPKVAEFLVEDDLSLREFQDRLKLEAYPYCKALNTHKQLFTSS